jgi:hypothetical protein
MLRDPEGGAAQHDGAVITNEIVILSEAKDLSTARQTA